jgi:predicted nucleic acid-binding Zn ribbon protein
MIGGWGHILHMVETMKENLSRLPSKQRKFKLGSKFREGWLPEKTRQNRKLKVKEISESELAEVISNIRLEIQEERRRQRQLILPLCILIAALILIIILIVFSQLLEWYWSGGKEYLRGRR